MIRELNNNEVEDIMKIWLDASIRVHDFIDKRYWIDKYEAVKTEYIPNSETYVYVQNDEIKGFISVINESFIGALFIESKSQGQGIGSKLIDFVVEKYNELTLSVYKENSNAINFYKRKGFKILSEDLDEYTNKVEFFMKYS